MKKKKIFSVLLFVIGLGILLYPTLSRTFFDFYYQKESEKIIEAFTNDEISEDLYQQQLAYNQSSDSESEAIGVAEVGFIDAKAESQNQSNPKDYQPRGDSADYLNNKNVLGILSVPKINIVYPIYNGATYENLLDGVARIEGTSYPVGGKNTNSVIAGHNGLVGRTYFSHIKKLVSGDLIEVQNRKETLTYEVYKTSIIEPEDTAALAPIPGEDTLTLLTCTWPPPGTHRYLIFAQRVSE